MMFCLLMRGIGLFQLCRPELTACTTTPLLLHLLPLFSGLMHPLHAWGSALLSLHHPHKICQSATAVVQLLYCRSSYHSLWHCQLPKSNKASLGSL